MARNVCFPVVYECDEPGCESMEMVHVRAIKSVTHIYPNHLMSFVPSNADLISTQPQGWTCKNDVWTCSVCNAERNEDGDF